MSLLGLLLGVDPQVENHHGRVSRRRQWVCGTEVLAPGWRWVCTCLDSGTAYTWEGAMVFHKGHRTLVRLDAARTTPRESRA